MPNQSAVIIDEILRDCRTIAVVGLSSSPARPSYGVTSYMKTQQAAENDLGTRNFDSSHVWLNRKTLP